MKSLLVYFIIIIISNIDLYSNTYRWGVRDYFSSELHVESYNITQGFFDQWENYIIENKPEILTNLDSNIHNKSRVFMFDLSIINNEILAVEFRAFIKPIAVPEIYPIDEAIPLGDHSTDDGIYFGVTDENYQYFNNRFYAIPLGTGISDISLFNHAWDSYSFPSELDSIGGELILDFSNFNSVSYAGLDGITIHPSTQNTSLINELNSGRYFAIVISDDTDIDYAEIIFTTSLGIAPAENIDLSSYNIQEFEISSATDDNIRLSWEDKINVSNDGQFYKAHIEKSNDLINWSPLDTSTNLNSIIVAENTCNLIFTADTDTKFFRFKMSE